MPDLAPEGRKVVGKGIPKPDAKTKATGAARYAGDMRPQKRASLVGKILRSPHHHANIVAIDITAAAEVDGVFAVVTGKDVTPARIGRFLRDRTVLARDKVRYIGEPVAAVAAVDEATADEALSLVRVEYQELPAVLTPEEALSADAPIIHEELASYEDLTATHRCGNQRNLITIERGDVEAAFAKADIVVEGRFTTPPVHQGFIEPKACVADVGKDGKVTVWSTNKGPFLCRSAISFGLGLPLSKVRVVNPSVGGDFGGKGAPTIEPICALLAIKARRPVKLALSGEEELATNFVRHPSVVDLKIAASRDGKLLGVDGSVVYNCGAYCDGINGMAHSCANFTGAYNVPAVRSQGLSVFTNSIPAGHVRAPGAPQTLFAIETLMDELAQRVGMDPFDIRRLNALKEGDIPPDGNGTMGSSGLQETIERVAERVSHYAPERRANQGLGVACGVWHVRLSATTNPTKCIIKLNEDGSATLLTGMPDNGAGQHIVLAQVVSEVLGVDTDEVYVVAGDTDVTPYDSGPGGSDGTVRGSHATRFAAEDARRQIIELAASVLEANPKDLEIGNRKVYVKGSPERAMSLAEVARIALTSPKGAIVGIGSSEREQWQANAKKLGRIVSEGSYCTHAAQVEVDPETGQVSVLKYVAAQDVGVTLNSLNATGQIHGSVVAGLGHTLTEELVVQAGRIVNPSLSTYLMPAADTMPTIETILVEHPSALGPYGAKGIGETSITPVAAVISNAIYDAVGVRIRDLPITPEKVLRALKDRQELA